MNMFSNYDQRLLDHVKKIHFIGCGGSGMYPLIQILAAKGYEISGSDVLDGSTIRAEREMGVKVSLGHNADNVYRVIELWLRSEYKRAQCPVGPKVSRAMLGRDVRLPLTSRPSFRKITHRSAKTLA